VHLSNNSVNSFMSSLISVRMDARGLTMV
jgi:hypothetical protein